MRDAEFQKGGRADEYRSAGFEQADTITGTGSGGIVVRQEQPVGGVDRGGHILSKGNGADITGSEQGHDPNRAVAYRRGRRNKDHTCQFCHEYGRTFFFGEGEE